MEKMKNKIVRYSFNIQYQDRLRSEKIDIIKQMRASLSQRETKRSIVSGEINLSGGKASCSNGAAPVASISRCL